MPVEVKLLITIRIRWWVGPLVSVTCWTITRWLDFLEFVIARWGVCPLVKDD